MGRMGEKGEKRKEKRGKKEQKVKKKGIVVKKRENILILFPCLIIGPYDCQKKVGVGNFSG